MSVESTRAPAPPQMEGEVDLGGLGALLWARRNWIALPTLAALLGSVVFVNVVTPKYTGEARVLLEMQDAFQPRIEKTDPSGGTGIDSEAVGSQAQLMMSRDLGRRVIKQLGLAGNPEFDPLAGGIGPLSQFMIAMGLKKSPTDLSPEDRILQNYGQKLTVFSPPKTRVLNIEFQSKDPDLAARAANAVAEVYLEFQQEAKRENARIAATSLGSLVNELKTRLAAADAKVDEFRAQTGLYTGSNNAMLSSQQLGEVNTEVSRARTAQADAHAKARLIREMIRQSRIGEIPDVANNELIRRISEQRVTLKAQIALESRTLLPGHPRMKELTAQLADIEGELRTAAEKTARTLENEARIAGARVENLVATLDQQKKVIGSSSADETQLRDLERSSRLIKDELEAASAKYQDAMAAQNSKSITADARIISRAHAPQTPAFPKKIPIISFATIGALVLSIGVIVAKRLLSSPPSRVAPASVEAVGLRREEDESAETAPVVAQVERDEQPTEAAAPDSEVIRPIASAAPMTSSPSARTLIVGVEARSSADRVAAQELERLKTLGRGCVLAACDGENDGGFAVSLARALSAHARCILVVLGPRIVAPRAHKVGLGELCAGGANFSLAIQRDNASRLHYIDCGLEPVEDADALAHIIDALVETYDCVVLGAPYDLSVANAEATASRASAAYILAQDGRRALALAEALEAAGAPPPELCDVWAEEASVA